ncbi:BnaA08g24990D [Brassica napus]|uniref:BnaA08g24990D protein n=1 Tax=Brassica napus TaxID=3708 RepID=A0A078G6H2_BRANA|nr:BnaA08g24990D [Brassica napus]
MKKLYRKGTVHPSPQIKSDDHLLSHLPVAIFSLAAVLSPKDREVLAYLLSTASYSSNRNYTSRMNKTKLHEKSRLDNHAPLFHCDCFSCYTCYWVRWDSSPSRQLIHEIIDAYEDSLEKKKQTKKKKNVSGKKDRRKRSGNSSKLVEGIGGCNGGLESTEEFHAGDGSEEAEEEKGSVRRFVSFIGEKVFGVWG